MAARLGPLLEEGRVTTLVGPPALDLAALTCAIALSVLERSRGRAWVGPIGLGSVSIAAYAAEWATWRGVLAEICAVAGVVDAVVDVNCRNVPWGEKPPERDPDSKPRSIWRRSGALVERMIATYRLSSQINSRAPPASAQIGYVCLPWLQSIARRALRHRLQYS